MNKGLQIIVRKNDGTLVFDCELPRDIEISIFETEVNDSGWKKLRLLWDNLTDEKKSKMLEHLTSQNNEDT